MSLDPTHLYKKGTKMSVTLTERAAEHVNNYLRDEAALGVVVDRLAQI